MRLPGVIFNINNEFAKNVLTVMTGTLLAQAIPIAFMPIMTRVFTPEDFGLFALYGAIVAILGVVSTGRYEIAIMLPKEDEDAKTLLHISVLIAFVISLILISPVLLWSSEISEFLGNPSIGPWLYLVPLSVLLTGAFNALTYWNNRKKKFRNIAISRVNQSCIQGISQVGFGFTKTSGGLVLGHFIGLLASVLYLLEKDTTYKFLIKKYDKKCIREQIRKYRKFPTYGVFGGLCDATAAQMPIIILSKFYSSTSTGMFSLTFRVLNIPTSVISSAISQVLFQKIVEMNQSTPYKIKAYIIKIFFLLLMIYSPAIPVLAIWGESIFSFIFGEEWRQAGLYSQYLVLAVAVRFAVSPLSAVLALERNIKKGVFWQALYICTITVTLCYASDFPVEEFIVAYVIHEVILYSIYLVFILQGSAELTKQ